jgi:hypothetical protein
MYTLNLEMAPSSNTLKPFSDDSLIFTWNIDEHAGLINITLDCATTGWSSFGFSDTGAMKGSDVVICYSSQDSLATCVDGYSKGHSFDSDESLGGTNDITNVTGNVSNGRTVIKLSKKLDSKDVNDKAITQGSEMKVLFALRKQGNPSTENGQFKKHSARTVQSVTLWPITEKEDTASNPSPTLSLTSTDPDSSSTPASTNTNATAPASSSSSAPTTTTMPMTSSMSTDLASNTASSTSAPAYRVDPDVHKMYIGMNRLSIPAQKTFYACKYFNIKNMAQNITQMKLGTIYHAIAFEASIDNINRAHHAVMYACPDASKIKYSDQAFDCTTNSLDENCPNPVMFWAPGMGPIVMPLEAGLVWGSADTEAIMLEIHYSNDDKVSGEIDSSFFIAYFTTKLRQYDLGVMTTGKFTGLFSIPPGQKNYAVSSSCTAACTSKMPGPINIFGYIPHGHMILTKLDTDIKNPDSTSLDLLSDNFNFHQQRFIQPNSAAVIKPGFSAITTCTYDSSSRAAVTQAGIGSDDEMCFNFIFYYPKENGLSWCMDADRGDSGCVLNKKVYRDISSNFFSSSYLLMLLISVLLY